MIATDNKSATDKQVEVSWFSALCDDDYRFLGVEDAQLKSSWQHCRDITLAADRNGYDNILLPSGYQLGIDSVAFAGGVAAALQQINLLVAVRCGELWVPQLARQMATLQQMLQGRLSINIISSDLPGEQLASQPRYARTRETMQILSELLAGRDIDFQGEFYQLALQAPRITQNDYGCPLFYFGGLSEPARNVAAECADVFLMWPDTLDTVTGILTDMRQRSAGFQRQLRYGYRVHVIVRETEAQAQEAARQLVSRLDSDVGVASGMSRECAIGGERSARQTSLRGSPVVPGRDLDHKAFRPKRNAKGFSKSPTVVVWDSGESGACLGRGVNVLEPWKNNRHGALPRLCVHDKAFLLLDPLLRGWPVETSGGGRASRLLTPLTRFRKYNAERQTLMTAE